MLATFPNLGLTWDDLDWLREQTKLPLLVKGVLTADDARLALEHGVDGVIVSNHGGRQVDGAVAALDALVEVRDALPDAVVLMDGGIRRAADVLKAIALGADAVLLGRPYAYALAVGGQRGVEELIQNLMAEIDLTSRSPARTRSASSTGRGCATSGVVLSEPRRGRARGDPSSTSPGRARCSFGIEATGVCHSDLHVIEEDGWGTRYPVLLGHEGAGTVEAVGEGVDGLRPPATASCSAGRPPAARAPRACAASRAAAGARRRRRAASTAQTAPS